MAQWRLIDGGRGGYATTARGTDVLRSPLLNKGSAFPADERRALGLDGLLPPAVLTLHDQVRRAYRQYSAFADDLQRNTFLSLLHDRNEVLFYRLVADHLPEMMPVVYTPTAGAAIEQYSKEFRGPRGVFLDIEHPEAIESRLRAAARDEVDVVCVTDSEQILGIGDQGVGGIGICIAKLVLYVLAAGLHPARALPVVLDVGTERESLLDDPVYLGLRRRRVRGAEYDDFVDQFVDAVRRLFPRALLHWEDFGVANARRILERHRDLLPTFNDDMQGTGAVTVAVILAACHTTGTTLADQRVVVYGSGTAGMGIADQLVAAMVADGLPAEDARRRFWCLDRPGLLVTSMAGSLPDYQRPYARPDEEAAGWAGEPGVGLLEVVRRVRPTVLIGTSTRAGAFTEAVVRTMADGLAGTGCQPIILPLSNPTRLAEADPRDVLDWTGGRAFVATGSPFPPWTRDGVERRITSCNNVFVFPALGLGTVAAQATRVSDGMVAAAVRALARLAPALDDPTALLLPRLEDLQPASAVVAAAVARAAQAEGVAGWTGADVDARVAELMWTPAYQPVAAEE